METMLKVGDFVQSKVDLLDDDVEPARRGDTGEIVFVDDTGPWVTAAVRWERTGRVYDVTPDEVDVLAEAGFASSEQTTPKKTRRVPVKRGVS